MKYSKEFLEANARLKTLDEETLNDELNKMSFDELLEHRDYMIQQELGEENQLSEEEAQEQIEELLQMTREPSTDEIQPIQIHTHRTGKRIAVLIAAILIMVSVFTVAAVASKRDFSILNGIVRFEDGKVYISFSKNTDIPLKTLAELETDLREHGFDDVRLPNYFFCNDWSCLDIRYHEGLINQANFDLQYHNEFYSFVLYKMSNNEQSILGFKGVEDGETLYSDNAKAIYLLDHGADRTEIKAFIDNYAYSIVSSGSNTNSNDLLESLKKGGW